MSCHNHFHEPPPAGYCSCCCSAPALCGGYYGAPPQAAVGSDQLLHAIAAYLLLNTAPPPPPPPQPQQQQPPPASRDASLYYSHAYHYQQQQGPKPQAHSQAPPQHQPDPPDHGHMLLQSLLRRVAAIETTLPRCFSAPPQALLPLQPTPRPQHRAAVHQEAPLSPPPRCPRVGWSSERELAALTIQEHFHRFLARRSRTLRHLKELAILRSKAAALRGSLSSSGRRMCSDPTTISKAAMGLLLHLDAIQGGDPMIREGKRAVSRELSRILEFVDKVLIKEHEEMTRDGASDDYHQGCNGAFGVNLPVMSKKLSFSANRVEDEDDESSESSSSTD